MPVIKLNPDNTAFAVHELPHDINFIHEDFRHNQEWIDKHFLFSDDMLKQNPALDDAKDEVFVFFDDSWTMADIWVHVGMFPSKTQANKNNHGGEIPPGFSDTIVKLKRGIAVTILNK